jgi:membrane protein implicated in regulation of membrane protease activity
MASGRKMMLVGITWTIVITVLYIMAIIGGVWWKGWNEVIMRFPIPAPVQQYVGQIFWIQALTFTLILVIGIVVTYKMLQATADESDYGMEYP